MGRGPADPLGVPPVPAAPTGGPRTTGAGRVALIAHDNRKTDLLEWARYNRLSLVQPTTCGHRDHGHA